MGKTHFGFLLQVERVDLLELALQAEKEGGLVGLQRGLRVLERHAVGGRLLRGEDGRGAQFLDELWLGGRSAAALFSVLNISSRRTFLSAL